MKQVTQYFSDGSSRPLWKVDDGTDFGKLFYTEAEAQAYSQNLVVPSVEFDCETCQDSGEVGTDGCQDCCEHGDKDAHCCLICGAELEPSDYGDEDYGSDR